MAKSGKVLNALILAVLIVVWLLLLLAPTTTQINVRWDKQIEESK